jgi:hypothetical protein
MERQAMSDHPNPPSAPNKATCDLLKGLAARFVVAGENHSQWRHYYASAVDKAVDGYHELPSWKKPTGVRWSGSMSEDWADPDAPISVMEGPGGRRGGGGEVFEDFAFEAWGLLPQLFIRKRTEFADAVEPWLAIVYDRLANTPFVTTEQRRDEKGALWEIKTLTINPFEASARAIELLLTEWGVSNSTSTVEMEKGEGNGGKKSRGAPPKKETKQRANFAKPLVEQGLTWPEIFEQYSKTPNGKADKEANPDAIRLAYGREYPAK